MVVEMVQLDRQVQQDLPVPQEPQVRQELVEHQVRQELAEHQVRLELLELLDQAEHQEPQDQAEHRGQQDLRVHLGHLVSTETDTKQHLRTTLLWVFLGG